MKKDELYDEAVRIVSEFDRASASILQRKLSIGQNRAFKLINQLEKTGIVSASDGTKPRSVLVGKFKPEISYKEFVEKYQKGEINVAVHKTNSLKAIDAGYLPKRYFWAHTLWSWFWLLSIPVGIIWLFFDTLSGILILFFISFLGGRAVKKAASQFVLKHALENEDFYNFTIESETLIIKKTS